MPSTEVQRTLVKSPPELWAELSDPAALARHLGELGEIQLTRVEPESAVEWEAENIKGSVELKASGWGTKVTFSLTREPALPEPAPAQPASAEPEPPQMEPEAPAPAPALSEPTEPELTGPQPAPEPDAIPRRDFFARLFRRRRKVPIGEIREPVADLAEPEIGEPEIGEPTVQDSIDELAEAPALDATQEPPADTSAQPPDLAAELAAMEQAMVEQDTALLTAVLDRLGAAHHRPFSRG